MTPTMKPILILLLVCCACGGSSNTSTCKKPAGAYRLQLSSTDCGKQVLDVADLAHGDGAGCVVTDETFEGCVLDRSASCEGYEAQLTLSVDDARHVSGLYALDRDDGTACEYDVQGVAK